MPCRSVAVPRTIFSVPFRAVLHFFMFRVPCRDRSVPMELRCRATVPCRQIAFRASYPPSLELFLMKEELMAWRATR